MTAFQDMNTRKLKRAYRSATKAVWFYQRISGEKPNSATFRADLTRARDIRGRIAKELQRRGWDA